MSGAGSDRPRASRPGPAASPPGWDGLTSQRGTELLASAAAMRAAGDSLDRVGQRLRRDGAAPDELAAVLTATALREKAAPKFGANARAMLFTQAGLEQASRLPVAELHALRFAGANAVADLGCGLGAESLAFLRAGLAVRAVELDPLTADFAAHNLSVEATSMRAGGDGAPTHDVLTGDATELGAGSADAVFLDPARRTAGHRDTRRLASSDDYSPSLDFAFGAARAARFGGIKLGPGLDRELIPDDAEAQWVSVDGQVVEMGLWFGDTARPGIRRSAAVLRRDAGLVGARAATAGDAAASSGAPVWHELSAAADFPDADTRDLGEYLIEPDGAVIRARLIGKLAAELDAGMIHDGIAYLTADRATPTPFGQVFRILEELPAREKDLKRALTARGIGRLEIKKRGVDVDPAALRTRLRLKGAGAATLILSRSANRHIALLAERC